MEASNLISSKWNSPYLWVSVPGSAFLFYVFKFLYPNADFTQASVSYVEAAAIGANFSQWPIGYSKFLSLVHAIQPSDLTLAIVQYLMIVISAFITFQTIISFYNLPILIKNTLFIFLVFNPLNFYLANYVLPDGIFNAIGLLWLCNLLLLMNKPRWWAVATLVVVSCMLITLKIQALFYPLVSIVALFQMNVKIPQKVIAVGVMLLAIAGTLGLISHTAVARTGTQQIAPMLNWQLANNALYGYADQKQNHIEFKKEIQELDIRIKGHFASPHQKITPLNGLYYLYAFDSPLRQHWVDYIITNNITTEEYAWCDLAPTVGEYGKSIIQQSPRSYIKNFILPNTLNYIFPLPREISHYNSGDADGLPIIQKWFGYEKTKITSRFPNLQGKIFFFLSTLFFTINLAILMGTAWLIAKTKLTTFSPALKSLLLIGLYFYIISAIFFILVQPVDLTSVAFSLLVYPCFVLIGLSHQEINEQHRNINPKFAI